MLEVDLKALQIVQGKRKMYSDNSYIARVNFNSDEVNFVENHPISVLTSYIDNANWLIIENKSIIYHSDRPVLKKYFPEISEAGRSQNRPCSR